MSSFGESRGLWTLEEDEATSASYVASYTPQKAVKSWVKEGRLLSCASLWLSLRGVMRASVFAQYPRY